MKTNTTLPADREHRGIEVAVPLSMLVLGILFYFAVDSWILRPLIQGTELDDYRAILRLIFAVVLAIVGGFLVEKFLKRVWKSGRSLTLLQDAVVASNKGAETMHVDLAQSELIVWRYPMKGFSRGGRERRVPSGNYLVACQISSDDVVLSAFTFLSTKDMREILARSQVIDVNMAMLYGNSKRLRGVTPAQRPGMVTKERHQWPTKVWEAETRRWSEGFELEPVDFSSLMSHVEQARQRHPMESKSVVR